MTANGNHGGFNNLYSEANERAVLAACLADGRRVIDVRDILQSGDLYGLRHRYVLEAMYAVNARHQTVDMMTVGDELKRRGQLEDVGGGAFLNQLLGAAVNISGVEDHARLVANYAKRRKLAELADKFKASALDLNMDIEAVRSRVETAVTVLDESELNPEPVSMQEGIPDYFKRIAATRGMPAGVSGLATGFSDLDEALDGMRGLIILAGRPAMGKTALALSMALNVSLHAAVYLASMEMSRDEIYARFYASECDINPTLQRRGLRMGGMTDMQWQTFKDASGSLARYPIYIDDIDTCTPSWVVRRVERMTRRGKKPGLIILDYLQLMEADGHQKSREQEVSAIARGLKRASKKLGIPVLALAQINRNPEARQNKRPVPSDLRESGELEQAADTVIFIYRDVVYNEESPFPNDAEIIIGKGRHNARGVVNLHFDAARTKFSNAVVEKIDLRSL